MSELRDIVEFRSDRFAPVLPEDSQVNPQVYGAELAFWLCSELAKGGVVTSYPEYEDWGWYIEYITEGGSEFAVHCGNVGGARDHWLLSLRRYGRKMFGRDKPPYEEAAILIAGIRGLVNGEGFTEVSWLYDSNRGNRL
jgi:hypothetical protein